MPRKRHDLTGRTFGRLTVTRFYKSIRSGAVKRIMWLCDCSCGEKDIPIRGDGLRYGNTKSCGCIGRERASRKSALLTVNGVTKRATEWARAYGIGTGHIYDRLRYGMDVEQAITTPVGKRGHRIRQNNFCTSAGQ
jgi:hypothetical protein